MKSHNSVKRTKFLTHFFTYLFMIVLSIIVLYPILITVSTAFKAGNVSAFSLNFNSEWTLNNFSRLFKETLYGNWYFNTLIIATFTMICQVTIITLAGYTYSRYRFIGRNSSLKLFLIVQMVPTMAALTAFLCDGFITKCFRPTLVLNTNLYWWRYSNEHLVNEGLL